MSVFAVITDSHSSPYTTLEEQDEPEITAFFCHLVAKITFYFFVLRVLGATRAKTKSAITVCWRDHSCSPLSGFHIGFLISQFMQITLQVWCCSANTILFLDACTLIVGQRGSQLFTNNMTAGMLFYKLVNPNEHSFTQLQSGILYYLIHFLNRFVVRNQCTDGFLLDE